MAGQNQGTNMELFETYFRRADLDGDGRISGNEAVGFFQGANLPKPVLAQIWMHADQSHSGFLSRTEFYNALKLVTVAQSKRELTPDIVKAALYSPASAKIPPPKINLSATPGPPVNSTMATSAPQMGAVAPTATQTLGFRGHGVPSANISQNNFPSQQNQVMRPPQGMPLGTAPHPPMGMGSEFSRGGNMVRPGGPNPNISSDWLGARTGGTPAGPRGISPSIPSATSTPQPPVSTSIQQMTNDSKALVVSGNGFASDSVLGGDLFSAAPSKKQESSLMAYTANSTPASSAIAPVTSGPQPSGNSASFDSMQSAFTMQPAGGQIQRAQSSPNPASAITPVTSGLQPSGKSGSLGPQQSAFTKQSAGGQIQWSQSSLNPSQQVSSHNSSVAPSGISAGVGNSTSNNSQRPWPKMKSSDVQKYTKVFMEVDSDRDGKITGEQARNLFLSWRLPREVLKQVWDLSDQDNDSMLSLREFCFALYLMERYREGCPLPAVLPRNVLFDETLLSMTGQPNVNYGNAAWGPHPGFGQQQGTPGARPVAPPTGLRSPMPGITPQANSTMQPNQQKPRLPVSQDPFANEFNNREQNFSVNPKTEEAIDVDKKVEGKESVILDSKEKIEFYRTKMQELVLYKSRCDNRLNEITERALADKREAESQGKKYEEKYKQVAEIASKLTMEEARFREIQERKMELQQAIVNMEQGGSADGILQVRADRIQSDLEELLKALTERCKKHGIDVKSTAIIELPTGWQPGIQESAALWDEDWDKFEDEGFDNEVTFDKNVTDSPKTKSTSNQREATSPDGSLFSDSLSNANGKAVNSLSNHTFESEYAHSEDERSPPGSPARRASLDSPKEFSDVHFSKSTEADAESHRSFDESTWGGAFDNNDDVDSVWGFNPTKDSDSNKHNFFDSGDFGVSPVRAGSPEANSSFQKKSSIFEDSVPNTPHSKFNNSSPRYSEGFGDHYDNFSRFDSFSMHDGGFSPRPELTRFDSINSTKDFQSGGGFSSFDDSDPFGSSEPFKVSSANDQSPKKSSQHWSAF